MTNGAARDLLLSQVLHDENQRLCRTVPAVSMAAQDLRTATLGGKVTDGSGASVANAGVAITNADTNAVTRSKTNGEGAYYLPFLSVGNHRLEITSAGFKEYEQSGLVLNAGETPRVNVQLQVGAITDEIKVTGQASLLETDTAVVGSQEGAQANNDGIYHILGQPESQLSYTLGGV